MPELPEVETVARQLAPACVGRKIKRIQVLDPKLDAAELAGVKGRNIIAVRRSGKQIVFDLSRPRSPLFLCVHLRMTGRLLLGPIADGAQHLRALFELNAGELAFVDPRRFGTMRLHRDPSAFAPQGIEPLSENFTPSTLATMLARSSQQIKVWLLRQDRLVGLGNIYASEILFAARVDPYRPAASLDRSEVRRLHRATQRILNAAIDCCGTTFSDFQTAQGQTGDFGRFLRVYGKDGLPCPTCGSPIHKTTQGQRSTFHCESCQH